MYNVNLLCPLGFLIVKKQPILHDNNIFSSLLCNIYLNELDVFIKEVIIKKNFLKKE